MPDLKPPTSDKTALRQRLSAARNALSPAVQAKAAQDLAAQVFSFMDTPLQKNVSSVAGYWPLKSEISILPVLMALSARGVALCLPHTHGRDAALDFLSWSPSAPLVRGRFAGLVEPDPRHAAIVMPDIVLVPLLGFDRHCQRLGYGAGHYDRTFAHMAAAGHKPVKIGVAYDMQMTDDMVTEPHDVPLDAICTPTRVWVRP